MEERIKIVLDRTTGSCSGSRAAITSSFQRSQNSSWSFGAALPTFSLHASRSKLSTTSAGRKVISELGGGVYVDKSRES